MQAPVLQRNSSSMAPDESANTKRCESRKGNVADHWYPEDAEARAAVNFWLH